MRSREMSRHKPIDRVAGGRLGHEEAGSKRRFEMCSDAEMPKLKREYATTYDQQPVIKNPPQSASSEGAEYRHQCIVQCYERDSKK